MNLDSTHTRSLQPYNVGVTTRFDQNQMNKIIKATIFLEKTFA